MTGYLLQCGDALFFIFSSPKFHEYIKHTQFTTPSIRFSISGISAPIIFVMLIISVQMLMTRSDITHALVGFTFFISLHRILNSFFEV